MITGTFDRIVGLAAERAAAPNGLLFTERQLYYEVCRTVLPVQRLPRRPAFTVPPVVPYRAFRAALDRIGAVPGLLAPPRPRPAEAGAHTPEPDLFDYGLPRLLVCRSTAVAAMLRANGIPMESACPVVSAAELPLDPGITTMLARVHGTVYVLHDASPADRTFPEQLPGLTDIPGGVGIVPIGLRPAQTAPLHLTYIRTTDPARSRAVEVESVNPAVLLRSVHRLVRDVQRPGSTSIDIRRARRTGFLTWPAS
ncbi:hypothetical protein [Nocardia carnea]|uniref:hypothetical protein n=1 Tax=Nocardia carnea TaxID=37328 RepID=UPI0024579E9A|nr:hypothetical protein [Nocardia carnea]